MIRVHLCVLAYRPRILSGVLACKVSLERVGGGCTSVCCGKAVSVQPRKYRLADSSVLTVTGEGRGERGRKEI